MISTSKAGSHFVSLHRSTTAPAVLCRQLISPSCGIACAAGFLRCALYRSLSARLPSRTTACAAIHDTTGNVIILGFLNDPPPFIAGGASTEGLLVPSFQG